MKKIVISALFFILLIEVCYGWTSRTHQKIAADASKLTPYELKLLLKRHSRELLEGAISPLGGRKGQEHFLLVDGSYGRAHIMIDRLVKNSLLRLKTGKLSLGDFCFELGKISHYIAEVNNPILTGDLKRKGGWFYKRFVNYTDSNLKSFNLTFDGYENDLLHKRDYKGYAISSAIRSAGLYQNLEEEYLARMKKKADYNFDKKSIPFAVAYLSYNYSVTDTAKVWYYLWKELKGNLSFAPYSKNIKQKKK
jgi:hypothetical protein